MNAATVLMSLVFVSWCSGRNRRQPRRRNFRFGSPSPSWCAHRMVAPRRYPPQRLAFVLCLPLVQRFRVARMPLVASRWYDIPLRAALVATLVAIVVTLSNIVGPEVSGVIALFPAVFTSLILILTPRIGGAATAAGAGERTMGADRLRARDRGPAPRGAAIRPRRRARSRARNVRRLESRAVGSTGTARRAGS